MKLTKLITALLFPLLCGCIGSEEGVDAEVNVTLYDMMTFEGNSDRGAVLTMAPQGRLLTLTATDYSIDTEAYPPGQRLLAAYRFVGEPYETGDIVLSAIGPVFNGEPQLLDSERIEQVAEESAAIYVDAFWSEGVWLNTRLRLPAFSEGETQVLALAVDEASLQTPTARGRLVNLMPEGLTPEDTYLSQVYTAFNTTAMWHLASPECTRLVVEVDNARLPQTGNTFTFSRPDF